MTQNFSCYVFAKENAVTEEQVIKQAKLSLKVGSTKTLLMPATDTSTLTQQTWRLLQLVGCWRTFEGLLVTDRSSSMKPSLRVSVVLRR